MWARNSETKEVNGFIVDKGTPGFSAKKIENKVSLRIVQKYIVNHDCSVNRFSADLTFKDVFVPEKNRLAHAENFQHGVGKVLEASRVGVGNPTS